VSGSWYVQWPDRRVRVKKLPLGIPANRYYALQTRRTSPDALFAVRSRSTCLHARLAHARPACARAACQHIGDPMGLLPRTPGGRCLKMPASHGPDLASPTGVCLRRQGHRWSHPGGAPARPRSCRPIHAAVQVSNSRAQAQRAPCAPTAPSDSLTACHDRVRFAFQTALGSTQRALAAANARPSARVALRSQSSASLHAPNLSPGSSISAAIADRKRRKPTRPQDEREEKILEFLPFFFKYSRTVSV